MGLRGGDAVPGMLEQWEITDVYLQGISMYFMQHIVANTQKELQGENLQRHTGANI